jgi:sulfur transfer complex TusBCD TusB component (DsrH family)
MAKILNIVETVYRATLEEQDDTAIWISYMLRQAGADIDVLLRGNAVAYLVKGQDASGLRFGEWRQTAPPDIARDISVLREAGAQVLFIKDDLEPRGIREDELVDGAVAVDAKRMAGLFAKYDQVWAW